MDMTKNLEIFGIIVCLFGQAVRIVSIFKRRPPADCVLKGVLGPVLDWVGARLNDGEGARRLGAFTKTYVEKRMAGPGKDRSDRADMLGKLIRAKHPDGRQYSQ